MKKVIYLYLGILQIKRSGHTLRHTCGDYSVDVQNLIREHYLVSTWKSTKLLLQVLEPQISANTYF